MTYYLGYSTTRGDFGEIEHGIYTPNGGKITGINMVLLFYYLLILEVLLLMDPKSLMLL